MGALGTVTPLEGSNYSGHRITDAAAFCATCGTQINWVGQIVAVTISTVSMVTGYKHLKLTGHFDSNQLKARYASLTYSPCFHEFCQA